MKVLIVSIPMKRPDKLLHKSRGNKSLDYNKPVYFPACCIFAKKIEKGDEVKVIFIKTNSKNSKGEENKNVFIKELEEINMEIGAVLRYDVVETDFQPENQTYKKLITDLANKIPEGSEIYADITFGSKPGFMALFCALRFVEEFCDSTVDYIVYGKVEFNEKGAKENAEFYDTTSLYSLFKLLGSIEAADSDTALTILNDFFDV